MTKSLGLALRSLKSHQKKVEAFRLRKSLFEIWYLVEYWLVENWLVENGKLVALVTTFIDDEILRPSSSKFEITPQKRLRFCDNESHYLKYGS